MGILDISRRFAAHAVRAFTQKKFRYDLAFTASEASTAMLHQDGNLFSVARSTDGVYVLTCIDKLKRIYGTATVLKTGDWDAKVQALVEGGAATNTVTIEVNNIGTGLDDPEAEVMVCMGLTVSGGN
jgi:hypothetical protein